MIMIHECQLGHDRRARFLSKQPLMFIDQARSWTYYKIGGDNLRHSPVPHFTSVFWIR